MFFDNKFYVTEPQANPFTLCTSRLEPGRVSQKPFQVSLGYAHSFVGYTDKNTLTISIGSVFVVETAIWGFLGEYLFALSSRLKITFESAPCQPLSAGVPP